MKKVLFYLFLPFILWAVPNPYENITSQEKINIMFNYFLNESLEKSKPAAPVKKILKDDGATLDPVKYELYFSYIQRLKAIRESREENQKRIDEEYAGKIGFYNGKLRALKLFYEDTKNLEPFVQQSINKAFKIVFGQPRLENIMYNDEINLLTANLTTHDMYAVDSFVPQKVELFVYQDIRKEFMNDTEQIAVNVRLEKKGNVVILKDIVCHYKEHEFIGKFLNPSNIKIKLDLKINDDIFRPLEIGEKR